MANEGIVLLFGNHLYPPSHLHAHKHLPILMVEDHAICCRRRYHQQKLALVLAAMRDHRDALTRAGFDVRYTELQEHSDLFATLSRLLKHEMIRKVFTFEIHDQKLTRHLQRLFQSMDIEWVIIGDPAFLTSKQEFAAYAAGKRHLRMANFYKAQRVRLRLLLENGFSPQGGQWSFDSQNRKSLPSNATVPDLPKVRHSENSKAVAQLVADTFKDHPGDAQALWLPTDRSGALSWLRNFVEFRLLGFGTYEDAISSRSQTLFHRALSPLLNIGLLTPQDVLERVLKAGRDHEIPINDLEGFIRQLIGWREFINGVYSEYGEDMRQSNARNQHRQLTAHWYEATTGIPPLDNAIRTNKALGWNHHIERLMILANLMNLCEIQPPAAYEYFMENYIDAYDWVMVPNVFGMGLTSDAAVFATKPYVAGSNYMLKMSDYQRGDWCDVVDGLYWRFIHVHRAELSRNPRMAMIASGVDRIPATRRTRLFTAASAFLERCTTV